MAAAQQAPAAPTAAAATAPAAAVAAGAGEALYKQACQVCHAAGVAGAPKFGDKAAWAERLKDGIDGMTRIAIAGKGAMPPRAAAPRHRMRKSVPPWNTWPTPPSSWRQGFRLP